MDYETYHLTNFELQSGAVLPDARLAYKTYGKLNAARDNVVVLPTFYTGTHLRNEGFFGAGRAIDPARHFVVSINLFGNGLSSSPSNTPAPFAAADFPRVTFYDNVRAQHLLLSEGLGIERIALVTGWSMAGCQSFQWGAQYPEMVEAILPFCASARTSEHNIVFLEGVKAALTADGSFAGGRYSEPPVRGLKAFGRVYAGWAFSQTFYREQLYRRLGFGSAEELLRDWERDHLDWDANDLLCKLGAIRARTIVIACDNDLYFQPADNALEVPHIANGELRVYASPWGHCVASPGNDPDFQRFLDQAIAELLD